MNIPLIRLLNQQILSPMFSTPEGVVNWMGAIQAQDLTAATWAVALRTPEPSRAAVEAALMSGSIVRVHVNRPTWHFVTQADLLWMMDISRASIERSFMTYIKNTGIGLKESFYDKALDIIKSALSDGKSLTKLELMPYFDESNIPHTKYHIEAYLWRAETRFVVSGGLMRDGQVTYMLLDERLPRRSGVSKEKALLMYATKYFRSHSPATLQDFVWWSGLGVREARTAIQLMGRKLETAVINNHTYYIHTMCRTSEQSSSSVALLPAYDEYLLGYRDRSDVLEPDYRSCVLNNRGVFTRVIHQDGQLVGNWDYTKTKVKVSYFKSNFTPNEYATKKAIMRFLNYNAQAPAEEDISEDAPQ